MGQRISLTRVAGISGVLVSGIAIYSRDTLVGALCWTVAVVLSCTGYGGLLAFAVRQRVLAPLATVAGLGVLLGMSGGLARAGLLTADVQWGAVAVGLLALVATPPHLVWNLPRWTTLFVAVVGCLLVAVATLSTTPIIGDGANHTFAIKRLWDTGTLSVYHQLGAQIAGEAYLALCSGAQTTRIFDEGLCAVLLVALLASSLIRRDSHTRLPVFVVLALPILLQPAATIDDVGQWTTILFVVAAYEALDVAVAGGGRAWLVLPISLALLAMRHELLPLAMPLAATVVTTRVDTISRPVMLALSLAWSVALLLMQLGYHATLPISFAKVALLWMTLPLTFAVMSLLGAPSRSALGVLVFGAIALTIAGASHATSPSFQAPSTLPCVWLAAGLCVVLATDGSAASSRPAAGMLALAGVVAVLIFEPNFTYLGRERMMFRMVTAASELAEQRALGFPVDGDLEVAALQAEVPRGARIGFWGRSAARLDFKRNVIRDVSWPFGRWRTELYLSSLADRPLPALDYLIVENMRGRPQKDRWGWFARTVPTAETDKRLVPLREIGRARLYRLGH